MQIQKSMQELQKFFPELIAITDGTEQPIPRPKNKKKRKTYYSGKKKKHTVQNQITINLDGIIIHKSAHALAVIMITKFTNQNIPYSQTRC